MRISQTIFDDVASLFEYPGVETKQITERLLATFSQAGELKSETADTYRSLKAFSDSIAQLSVTDIEELYTRTFDINPSTSLEVGWHLYGERYERGAFLVLMRQKLKEYGVDEGSELPDHMTYVLRLFGRMDRQSRDEMLERYAIPGVTVLHSAWKGPDNPYRHLLDALLSFIRSLQPQQQGALEHD